LRLFLLKKRAFWGLQKTAKGEQQVAKEIIVLDSGFDFDEVAGPMTCCAGALTAVRA
jgi:hypothetical protein